MLLLDQTTPTYAPHSGSLSPSPEIRPRVALARSNVRLGVNHGLQRESDDAASKKERIQVRYWFKKSKGLISFALRKKKGHCKGQPGRLALAGLGMHMV